ncbi:MAG: C10 family peptidase [candidate division Zixibacteria bacterium]|nr:C10 family peptidase [candidate division Zixibacteria bacterium]
MRVVTILTIGLALLLCAISPQQARAEKATQEEMELVCQNWLSFMVHQKAEWAGETHPQIVGVDEIVEGDTLLARCFSISPQGFVVVPILKELPPIKAYSEEYGLDVNQRVGFPQLLREVLLHRIRLYAKTYGSLDAVQPPDSDVLLGREHRAEWSRFLKSQKEFKIDLTQGKIQPLTEVGPLLTTSWHQNDPYYNLCPIGYGGGHCKVGCVATAAAQIMKYWNWPPSGTGARFYLWDGDDSCNGPVGGGWLSADFSDPYDWQNMPDNCQSGCSQEQQDALAELCYEVGVAFEMDYGVCGSGTWTYLALTVFPTYFRYDSSIDRENRSDYSTADDWFSVIQAEIDSGRPMQYRISGHSIVCDGWRDTDGLNQYHINYGWGGSHTSWYTIDQIYGSSNPMVEYLIRNIIPAAIRGDANSDEVIDLGDVVYLINYLYRNGPAPNPLWTGDANCDGIVDLGDLVYLINYLYKGGPPPGC